jgi:integrase
MPLTTVQVRNANPGRHADGKGLYLLVKPSGARSWVLRIQSAGRRRDLGLGSVLFERKASVGDLPIGAHRELTLAEARDKAALGRTLVKAGLDPSVEWRKLVTAVPTFKEAATRYHENIKTGFRNARHSGSWLTSLEMHAFPHIGSMRVDRIDTAAIQSALLPIWLTIPETARRVRQRIGAVLDFAHGQGWRSTEAPLRSVSRGLPNQSKLANHYAAMPYADVPAFVGIVRGKAETVGRLALQFLILTAARSGEVRGATWSEIDLEAEAWTIPAPRMKAGKAHSVPLSPQAIGVLKTLAGLFQGRGEAPVFPGAGGRQLSDMTMTKALRDGGSSATVHGFRSSFRDWAAEQTSYPAEWAEAALAHVLANKVEAAYRRTQFFDQRRKLMDAWGDFVGGESRVMRLVG